jgi:hypothetical protein
VRNLRPEPFGETQTAALNLGGSTGLSVFTFTALADGNRFSSKSHHPLSLGEEREWSLSVKKEKLR